MSDSHQEFEALSRKIAIARQKREAAYFAWTAACQETNQLERDQRRVWSKMMDSITEGLPGNVKALQNSCRMC